MLSKTVKAVDSHDILKIKQQRINPQAFKVAVSQQEDKFKHIINNEPFEKTSFSNYIIAKNKFRYSPEQQHTVKLVKKQRDKRLGYEHYMEAFESANKKAIHDSSIKKVTPSPIKSYIGPKAQKSFQLQSLQSRLDQRRESYISKSSASLQNDQDPGVDEQQAQELQQPNEKHGHPLVPRLQLNPHIKSIHLETHEQEEEDYDQEEPPIEDYYEEQQFQGGRTSTKRSSQFRQSVLMGKGSVRMSIAPGAQSAGRMSIAQSRGQSRPSTINGRQSIAQSVRHTIRSQKQSQGGDIEQYEEYYSYDDEEPEEGQEEFNPDDKSMPSISPPKKASHRMSMMQPMVSPISLTSKQFNHAATIGSKDMLSTQFKYTQPKPSSHGSSQGRLSVRVSTLKARMKILSKVIVRQVEKTLNPDENMAFKLANPSLKNSEKVKIKFKYQRDKQIDTRRREKEQLLKEMRESKSRETRVRDLTPEERYQLPEGVTI
ncbi:hypothetical protein FGO68_gene11839 [Halteria grandinella]|uniref:Uncharacterized protein n=1 Tax=Halteria grandinella TaxID=5974 RepID=A0A8J8NDN4_HALGN|nr:hypothetical protein FGO68_gene11839 [Halteria grandinella]